MPYPGRTLTQTIIFHSMIKFHIQKVMECFTGWTLDGVNVFVKFGHFNVKEVSSLSAKRSSLSVAR